MAYNMSFEKGRIKRLAALYPDLSDHLMNIHDHFVDLMVPFQKRQYYTRDMQGSYSIKYVLPVLFPDDPELDYHCLDDIHNGSEASAAYEKMGDLEPAQLEECRKNLLKYCGLDTLAMVKIWAKLNEVEGKDVFHSINNSSPKDITNRVNVHEHETRSEKRNMLMQCANCGNTDQKKLFDTCAIHELPLLHEAP